MSAGRDHAEAALRRALDAVDALIRIRGPQGDEVEDDLSATRRARLGGLKDARARVKLELDLLDSWVTAEHGREDARRFREEHAHRGWWDDEAEGGDGDG